MWILYCILCLLDNVTCLWAESASDLCIDHTSKLLLSILMSGAAGFDQHLELILWKSHSFSSLELVLSGLFIPGCTLHLPHDFLTSLPPCLSANCYPSLHQAIRAFSLGFSSVKKLQYSPQTLLSLSLILSCHLQAMETIGSNLVSLSCCHGEWVSSSNQQLYLWPAEANLGDPI